MTIQELIRSRLPLEDQEQMRVYHVAGRCVWITGEDQPHKCYEETVRIRRWLGQPDTAEEESNG